MKRWLWNIAQAPVLWAATFAILVLLRIRPASEVISTWVLMSKWYVVWYVGFWAAHLALSTGWRKLCAWWELGNADYRRAMEEASRQ